MKRSLPLLTAILLAPLVSMQAAEKAVTPASRLPGTPKSSSNLAVNRAVISLDGEWQIAEGAMDKMPKSFPARVPVPGFADLATPAFSDVGVASPKRHAFWYRRTFTVPETARPVALLKIAKAQFGMKVWVNGQEVGDEIGCWAPGYFDVSRALKYGVENTVVVRVGAFYDALPAWAPRLLDGEVFKWPPGIYDSVSLSLMDSPFIVGVQTAPEIENRSVRVQMRLRNEGGERIRFPVTMTVREWKSGKVVGKGEIEASLPGVGEREFTGAVKLDNPRLWSPEDPFLYVVTCDTGADQLATRFGMREFRYDPVTGHAMLNGKRVYLLGGALRMSCFYNDPQRQALPWNRDWVRGLFEKPKQLFQWNSMRVFNSYCPSFWFDIADETGVLLQNEWPIWKLRPEWTDRELIRQLTGWVRDQWNHPSIVIWDIANETSDPRTAELIEAVRGLDLSSRPWDNSYGKRTRAGDPSESHSYTACPWSVFDRNDPPWDLSDLGSPLEATLPVQVPPVIINEIDTFWLRSDGSSWKNVFEGRIYNLYAGKGAGLEERREWYAYLAACAVEYWRARRDVTVGIHGPFYLCYDIPEGLTAHHFLDLAPLTLEPHFVDYTRNTYSPLAVMIDDYTRRLRPGQRRDYRIIITNENPEAKGGVLQLRILDQNRNVVAQASGSWNAQPWEQVTRELALDLPAQPGKYQVEAELVPKEGRPVLSRRKVEIVTAEQAVRLVNLAEGCPVTASSELPGHGASLAVDGKRHTLWSSSNRDPQWIMVDLGKQREVGAVSIDWDSSIWVWKMGNPYYTKAYEVEISTDKENWVRVASVTDGDGGRDVVEFAPSRVRYVRVNCKEQGERATTGNGKGDGQTDAQLTRPGTTAGGVEEWRRIATYENSAAAQILERPYGYRKLREGYDIWDLQVFEK